MTDYIAHLTPEIACEMLHDAGLPCSADEIRVIARDERWAAVLPGERLAWFPASVSGATGWPSSDGSYGCSLTAARFRHPEQFWRRSQA